MEDDYRQIGGTARLVKALAVTELIVSFIYIIIYTIVQKLEAGWFIPFYFVGVLSLIFSAAGYLAATHYNFFWTVFYGLWEVGRFMFQVIQATLTWSLLFNPWKSAHLTLIVALMINLVVTLVQLGTLTVFLLGDWRTWDEYYEDLYAYYDWLDYYYGGYYDDYYYDPYGYYDSYYDD